MLQVSKEEIVIFQQAKHYLEENYKPEQRPRDDDVVIFVDNFIDWRKPSKRHPRQNRFCKNILACFNSKLEHLKTCCPKAYPCTHAFDKICEGTFSPTKEAVCKLIIAAELDFETASRVLQSEDISLCQYNKFDVVMMFFLESEIYDFATINRILYLLGMPLWGWSFL